MQLRLKYTFSYFEFNDYKSNTEDLFEYTISFILIQKANTRYMKKPKPKPKKLLYIKPSLTCFDLIPKKSANLVHTLKPYFSNLYLILSVNFITIFRPSKKSSF